jgi:hypothetical protein
VRCLRDLEQLIGIVPYKSSATARSLYERELARWRIADCEARLGVSGVHPMARSGRLDIAIVSAIVADMASVARPSTILAEAFYENPILNWLMPDDASMLTRSRRFFAIWLRAQDRGIGTELMRRPPGASIVTTRRPR